MGNGDLCARAVERIYARGVGERKVSDALVATSRLRGACGATLEVIDKSAGGLIRFCPGGLPALAGTRHERLFAARNARMRYFISAALDRTEDRIVSVQRSR
jgi:hypothetical protein